MSNKLYIAMYHYTRDLKNSRYPAIHGLDYDLFKKQLAFFKEKMHPITMEDLIECIKSGNGGGLPENAVLLTFDDGYIDNYTCALPVLSEYKIQGSFFIPGKTITEDVVLDVNKIHFILATADDKKLKQTLIERLNYYRGTEFKFDSIEELIEKYEQPNRYDTKETNFCKRVLQTGLPERLRNIITSELFNRFVGVDEKVFSREIYMNRDQIKLLKSNGMFIGIHGYDHYWLGNLSESELEMDINKSLSVMDEFIDKNEWVMNYPYGNRSSSVIDFIKKKGAVIGLTTDVRVVDLSKDNQFEIPRLDTNDFPPKSNNYKSIGE